MNFPFRLPCQHFGGGRISRRIQGEAIDDARKPAKGDAIAGRDHCFEPANGKNPLRAPAILTGALLVGVSFSARLGLARLGGGSFPFLTLARGSGLYAAHLIGPLISRGELTFFVPVLQFMRVADDRMYAEAWLMLAFYCAVYFPVGLLLIRMLDRRVKLPMCVSVPLVWVGLEWVRSFLLTGFAWYYLGHAQHEFASLIQVADLGGVYAISFLVAAVNGWLCDVAFQIPAACADRFRWQEETLAHATVRGEIGGPCVAAWRALVMLLVGAVLYGTWRLEQNKFPGWAARRPLANQCAAKRTQ